MFLKCASNHCKRYLYYNITKKYTEIRFYQPTKRSRYGNATYDVSAGNLQIAELLIIENDISNEVANSMFVHSFFSRG